MIGITVLGATGSIGISTLDVVARHPARFRVVAVTAHRDAEGLALQCRLHRPAYAVMADPQAATRLRSGGRLVFAVCSVLPEECEHVVAALDDVLQPAPFDAPSLTNSDPRCPDRPPAVEPGATAFRLLPLRHGTDGYFIASFVRRD